MNRNQFRFCKFNFKNLYRIIKSFCSADYLKKKKFSIKLMNFKKSSRLFKNHIIKNPSFQAFLSLLKYRIEKLQTVTIAIPKTVQKLYCANLYYYSFLLFSFLFRCTLFQWILYLFFMKWWRFLRKHQRNEKGFIR